ncbi:MAG: SiaB family protein kinase [Bacteroidetes bacterium]|nr:SiaB family protein kinase [Bacteroidota bacterium]
MDLNKSGSIEETIFTKKVNSVRSAFIGPDKKVIVSHIGELDQDKVNTISTLVETQMEYLGVSKNATKKIFNIVIETLQNICIHGEKDNNGYQMTYFLIGKHKNEFSIFSGNIVSNSVAEKLNKRLNAIRSLNDSDLKKQYMDVLSNGELSAKGGAGLGFLTIALKSNNNVDFDFETLNKEYSLFSIQSKVLG